MRYITFEDRDAPLAITDTLAGGLREVLRRCRYKPVWIIVAGEVRLQFAYLTGPFTGQIVGTQFGENDPDTFTAPITDGEELARREVMQCAIAAGLKGQYAEREGQFFRGNMDIAADLVEKIKALAKIPNWVQ